MDNKHFIEYGKLPLRKGAVNSTQICRQNFDEERALFGASDLTLTDCAFDGPKDGESALKHSYGVSLRDCTFNLRYPLWHAEKVALFNCVMTENSRAALWYSDDIDILNSRLHGIKVLRECNDVRIRACDIKSPEAGWFCNDVSVIDSSA